MRFTWPCYLVRHSSGRFTAHSLARPGVFAHAATAERALEDLQLTLDDKVSRAHPGLVGSLSDPPAGTPEELTVEALTFWTPDGPRPLSVTVKVLVAPAHRPFLEVFAPRLGLRMWLPQDTPWRERAAEILKSHIERLPEHERPDVSPEPSEELAEVSVEAKPAMLSSLRYADLERYERAPPAPKGQADEGVARSDLEADYDEEVTGKKRRRPGAAAKPGERVATPTLRKLAVPLHKLARQGRIDRAFERDELVERLVARVTTEKPEAIVLVGPAGAGKTAVLHELVHRLTRADMPEAQRERPHFAIEATRLIAGEGFFGDWQQQLLDVLTEARAARAVLHLGHVIELLDAGKSSHSDANVAQLMGPALAAREAVALGEATPEEWSKIEQRSASFARAFAVVRLEEPPPEVTARIMTLVGAALSAKGKLTLEPGAITWSIALAQRFRPYGALVGNAVTFLRRLAASQAHAGSPKATGLDAIRLFSSESGIPEVLLRDDVALAPETVRDFLRKRVMGQDVAIDRVTEVVSVIKAALPDLRKPVGVLFFSGPTGVGKTELSKALAEFLFGSRDRLVRLDMGEYAGPDALMRLVGTYGEPGHLAAAVRKQPFSVVLLDEIEKAHPAVFDALLGVLGEGRLTDADGRFTDFRNCVLVMTSNLGADTLRSRVGFGGGSTLTAAVAGGDNSVAQREVRAHYVGEAERFFRPELFNRVDDFVVFSPLPPAVVRSIVAREVDKLRDREGIRRIDMQLDVTDAALDALAARGMDPRYGARPLKRAIERELVTPVATYLASHPTQGILRMLVDVNEQSALTFKPTTVSDAAGGALRKEAFEVLEAASELRAAVQRWESCSLARGLRSTVEYTDKASRMPGFFDDRAVSDSALRRSALGRDLLERLAALRAQGEAAEDLAMEAWFTRADAGGIKPLREEIALATKALEEIRVELYATLYRRTDAVTLFFRVARGGRASVEWLMQTYERWAERYNMRHDRAHLAPKRVPVRVEGAAANSTGAAQNEGEDEEDGVRYEWTTRPHDAADNPHPPGWALTISGGPAALLLAGEQGAHRFYESGTTHLVQVHFFPGAFSQSIMSPKGLRELAPLPEIRRVQPAKKIVHDHRYDDDFDIEEKELDLRPLCNLWLDHRALAREAEPWS